jgi:hypothetical protein
MQVSLIMCHINIKLIYLNAGVNVPNFPVVLENIRN